VTAAVVRIDTRVPTPGLRVAPAPNPAAPKPSPRQAAAATLARLREPEPLIGLLLLLFLVIVVAQGPLSRLLHTADDVTPSAAWQTTSATAPAVVAPVAPVIPTVTQPTVKPHAPRDPFAALVGVDGQRITLAPGALVAASRHGAGHRPGWARSGTAGGTSRGTAAGSGRTAGTRTAGAGHAGGGHAAGTGHAAGRHAPQGSAGQGSTGSGTAPVRQRALTTHRGAFGAGPGSAGSMPAHGCAGTAYTVRSGDSLWSIAQRHYGASGTGGVNRQWRRIWRANRGVIGSDPGQLAVGASLCLPGP
jgi:nucleoid-associated protein YgaU